jgi:hypothetical protein
MTHGMAKRPLTSLAITHGMEIFLQEGLMPSPEEHSKNP